MLARNQVRARMRARGRMRWHVSSCCTHTAALELLGPWLRVLAPSSNTHNTKPVRNLPQNAALAMYRLEKSFCSTTRISLQSVATGAGREGAGRQAGRTARVARTLHANVPAPLVEPPGSRRLSYQRRSTTRCTVLYIRAAKGHLHLRRLSSCPVPAPAPVPCRPTPPLRQCTCPAQRPSPQRAAPRAQQTQPRPRRCAQAGRCLLLLRPAPTAAARAAPGPGAAAAAEAAPAAAASLRRCRGCCCWCAARAAASLCLLPLRQLMLMPPEPSCA